MVEFVSFNLAPSIYSLLLSKMKFIVLRKIWVSLTACRLVECSNRWKRHGARQGPQQPGASYGCMWGFARYCCLGWHCHIHTCGHQWIWVCSELVVKQFIDISVHHDILCMIQYINMRIRILIQNDVALDSTSKKLVPFFLKRKCMVWLSWLAVMLTSWCVLHLASVTYHASKSCHCQWATNIAKWILVIF